MRVLIAKIGVVVLGLALFITPTSSLAVNNALVISDANFADSDSMNATQINDFLIAKGSKFANYVIPQFVDVPYPLAAGGLTTVAAEQKYDVTGGIFYGKTVAQLIAEECIEHGVNPKVILATLEKESSAITGDVFRSSTVAAWPMFYMYDETMAGCLNSGVNCNDSAYRNTSINYGGAGQQIAYSTAWFGLKYSQYKSTGRPIKDGNGNVIRYEQFNEALSIDGQTIVCESAGTRILYLYTPHIQTSFFNLYTGFFGDPTSAPSGEENPPSPPPPPPRKAGDGNGDSAVDSTDLSILADSWGKGVAANTGADFNADGVVDSTDLSILADAWGK